MLFKRINIRKNNDKVTLSAYVLDCGGELANTNKRPAVLIMPGGGYTVCSDREAEPVAMAFMAEGYHAFILRYSVGEKEKFQHALEDAENALKMIIDKSGEWHVDTDKIAAIGFSAGGHLAAALSTMGEVRPSALILGYPCILEAMGNNVLAFDIPGLESKIDSKTPSTFLFSTFEDELVPINNTIRFMDELNKKNIPFEAHIFQKGRHGLSLAKPLSSAGFSCYVNREMSNWFPMSINWLHGLFGDFKADAELVMPGVECDENEYSLNTAIKVLWENEEAKNVALKYIPVLENEEQFKLAKDISLNILYQYAKELIDENALKELEMKLKEIKRR